MQINFHLLKRVQILNLNPEVDFRLYGRHLVTLLYFFYLVLTVDFMVTHRLWWYTEQERCTAVSLADHSKCLRHIVTL